MAGITTAIGLTLGAASLGYGIYERTQAQSDQEDAQRLRTQGYQTQATIARDRNQLSRDQSQTSREYASSNYDLETRASDLSRSYSNRSQEITRSTIQQEMAIQQQRRQAMELDASRKQKEVIRNQQRARSLALTTATAQGASRGSGLQGGYGQISGQSGVNALGIQQNLQIGRNIFDYNYQISQNRIAASELETQYSNDRADLQNERSQMLYNYALTNADYQDRSADLDTRWSNATGQLNYASGMSDSANYRSNSGSTYMNLGSTIFNMSNTASNVFATNSSSSNSNSWFNWSDYTNPYYGPGY